MDFILDNSDVRIHNIHDVYDVHYENPEYKEILLWDFKI
jgi:hypothetical protein